MGPTDILRETESTRQAYANVSPLTGSQLQGAFGQAAGVAQVVGSSLPIAGLLGATLAAGGLWYGAKAYMRAGAGGACSRCSGVRDVIGTCHRGVFYEDHREGARARAGRPLNEWEKPQVWPVKENALVGSRTPLASFVAEGPAAENAVNATYNRLADPHAIRKPVHYDVIGRRLVRWACKRASGGMKQKNIVCKMVPGKHPHTRFKPRAQVRPLY